MKEELLVGTEAEKWAVVPISPAYEVSSLGRVRRILPGRGTCPGKILKPYVGSNGYPNVKILAIMHLTEPTESLDYQHGWKTHFGPERQKPQR